MEDFGVFFPFLPNSLLAGVLGNSSGLVSDSKASAGKEASQSSFETTEIIKDSFT